MKSVQRAGVQLLLRYLSDRPLEKLPKMFDLAEKLDPGKQQAQKIQAIRSALLDEDSNWRRLTENLFQEVDKRVIRKLMESFMINANLFGLSRKHALEEKYDCNIPWAILMDPTSACNLSHRLLGRPVRKEKQPLLRDPGFYLPPGQGAGSPFLHFFRW